MKISSSMISCAYEYGIKVYRKEMAGIDARAEVYHQTGMDPGSAGDYINNLQYMLAGQEYKRTMNMAATEYFLIHIGEEFGRQAQQKAAEAVAAHVRYYERIHSYLPSIDKIALKYK